MKRALSAAAALVLCAAGGNARRPPEKLREVARGIYLFKDTCNVYAIVRDRRAILIDFGSGTVLNELAGIGVERVSWVVHTHFHRDHTQGDELARARGIRIAVPESERKYFETAEKVWDEKKVFVLYDLRNEFAARSRDLPVDRGLAPGTPFEEEGVRLDVLATPGHSEGSVSFLLDTGRERILFCGDLAASQGKIPTLHDLEWPYVGVRGLEAEMNSLKLVIRQAPDLLLPGHGNPSARPAEWTPSLLARLAQLYRIYDWNRTASPRPRTGPKQLLKHVWQSRPVDAYGVGYILVSDSGHALLWDVNASETRHLEDMERRAGFRSIDAVIPSHYHEDHVGGIGAVKARYGAKLWAMSHMVDVLENPAAYNLPCLWPEGFKVDRVLTDREKIVWEGIPLQFFYLPGQTEYSQGMLVEVDGTRLLFDGDNVAKPLPGTALIGHFVCRNFLKLDGGHLIAARRLLELRPDFVCPNHFEWSRATPAVLESYRSSSEEFVAAVREIIDQPDPQLGVDNNWASIYPYQVDARPGAALRYRLKVRNWLSRTSRVKASFRAPEGWVVTPASVEVEAGGRGEAEAAFVVQIPATEPAGRRRVLTADLWRDGERLGELTEALVNFAPMKAH
jgi:glyoxylase-like metal-dependent hydrolase (beta-lactamase superfamily II)